MSPHSAPPRPLQENLISTPLGSPSFQQAAQPVLEHFKPDTSAVWMKAVVIVKAIRRVFIVLRPSVSSSYTIATAGNRACGRLDVKTIYLLDSVN